LLPYLKIATHNAHHQVLIQHQHVAPTPMLLLLLYLMLPSYCWLLLLLTKGGQ
jgi:hypothetical protein